MNNLYHLFWKKSFELGLQEDNICWDWTSRGVYEFLKGRSSRAQIISKSDGVWSIDGLLETILHFCREREIKFEVKKFKKDGERFFKDEVVCEWFGEASVILGFERSFLNVASYACGISKMTADFVEIVSNSNLRKKPSICLTRKTLPGLREVSVHAVQCGGGAPHRGCLSSGILLKENHIKMAGSIHKAVLAVRTLSPHGLKVEVEVSNFDELDAAISAKADIIMLDNFKPSDIVSAVSRIAKSELGCLVEVSGGVHLNSIKRYLVEGVDIISIGSLTHSTKAVDLSLLIQ